MIREDYIMRMIEQLVKVLAKILFNKERGNYNAAISNIEEALNTIAGLDYKLIDQLSADDLIALLGMSKDNRSVPIKCIIIAKLLKEKGDIAKQISNDTNAHIYNYQKAIILYLNAILNYNNDEMDLSNYYSDVKEIGKTITNEIADGTRFNLFKFYKLINELERAEDELFILKKLHYPGIEEEGILFFSDLEKLSETELMKGNLSKEEIKQSKIDFIQDATWHNTGFKSEM